MFVASDVEAARLVELVIVGQYPRTIDGRTHTLGQVQAVQRRERVCRGLRIAVVESALEREQCPPNGIRVDRGRGHGGSGCRGTGAQRGNRAENDGSQFLHAPGEIAKVGKRRVGADRSRRGEAVHLRHLHVHQDARVAAS